jgi:hypothetical protein
MLLATNAQFFVCGKHFSGAAYERGVRHVELPGLCRRKIFPTAQEYYSDTSESSYTGLGLLI